MQIILGIFFIAIILAVFLSRSQSIDSKTKTAIIVVFSIVIIAAILYEFMFSKKEQNNRELINAFKQDKMLICKGADVNNTYFILETGTLSFMAKNNYKKIIGTIYSIKDCSIKE